MSAQHCFHCAEKGFHPKKGIICSISGEKEKIAKYCTNFKFRPESESHWISVLALYERYKKRKVLGITLVSLFIAAGSISIGLFYMWKLHELGYVSNLPFYIIGIGLLFLSSSAFTFQKGIQKHKDANSKKEEFEMLLNTYPNKVNFDANPKVKMEFLERGE